MSQSSEQIIKATAAAAVIAAPAAVIAAPAPVIAVPAAQPNIGAAQNAGGGMVPIEPLRMPKTITITFVPDWTHKKLNSPTRPASLVVGFGPPGTQLEDASWSFECNVWVDPSTSIGAAKKENEEVIPKEKRAILWWANMPFPKYEDGVVNSGCRLSTRDDLRTLSIILREVHVLNALSYVQKKAGVSEQQHGFFKLKEGCHYFLNMTFAAGSTIEQMVRVHGWLPFMHLRTKKLEKSKTGLEFTETITSTRLFTNYNTNWAQGVELNPDDMELKQSHDALIADIRADVSDAARRILLAEAVMDRIMRSEQRPDPSVLQIITSYMQYNGEEQPIPFKRNSGEDQSIQVKKGDNGEEQPKQDKEEDFWVTCDKSEHETRNFLTFFNSVYQQNPYAEKAYAEEISKLKLDFDNKTRDFLTYFNSGKNARFSHSHSHGLNQAFNNSIYALIAAKRALKAAKKGFRIVTATGTATTPAAASSSSMRTASSDTAGTSNTRMIDPIQRYAEMYFDRRMKQMIAMSKATLNSEEKASTSFPSTIASLKGK